MYRITRVMTKVDGKATTIKIDPIICSERYLELYRKLFELKDVHFKGFVKKNIIEKDENDLKYLHCKIK